MNLTSQKIEAVLADYVDPYLGRDWISSQVIKEIHVNDREIRIEAVLGYPAEGIQAVLIESIKQKLADISDNRRININLSWKIIPHAAQQGLAPHKNIKNIIAVASGKGGVGKSTTAVNLALALSAEGAHVGILDADIYGPSQPMMLGIKGQPPLSEQKTLAPIMAHGIQSMSIGYLIKPETPMIWRGPMVTSALQQLLSTTQWDRLDYLVIDLPPGTGDIQLTLSQKIPVSGAVIITTPQDIALLDAYKSIAMFQKVRVPILGVIENMSSHLCKQCGHVEPIFDEGGGERLAEQSGVDLLGSLPLDKRIRQHADGGCPTVVAEPDGAIAHLYRDIARRVAAKLSLQAKSQVSKFPKIVIE